MTLRKMCVIDGKFNRYMTGLILAASAEPRPMKKTMHSCTYGKGNGMNSCVNIALCSSMVSATVMPTSRPIKPEEITRINASHT